MKKLLFLIFLFSLFFSLALAQKNTIYVIHQPTDMGIGLRYDRQISDYGFYLSASKGIYKFDDINCKHIKLVGGIVGFIPDWPVTKLFFAGISYNFYGDLIPDRVSFPLSIDLGAGCRINRFNYGFCMDFIKWEGVMNFGYSF